MKESLKAQLQKQVEHVLDGFSDCLLEEVDKEKYSYTSYSDFSKAIRKARLFAKQKLKGVFTQ